VGDAAWHLVFGSRSRAEVVRDYLAFADTGNPAAEYAVDAVDRMNSSGFPPPEQWALLRELVAAARTDAGLAFVAEVPLHEFLWHHDVAFGAEVVAAARADVSLARAMSRVGLTLVDRGLQAQVWELAATVPPLGPWTPPWQARHAEPLSWPTDLNKNEDSGSG
jgi:hypothetical protein